MKALNAPPGYITWPQYLKAMGKNHSSRAFKLLKTSGDACVLRYESFVKPDAPWPHVKAPGLSLKSRMKAFALAARAGE